MGKEGGNDGDRGGGAFELASDQGDAYAAKAAAYAATKDTGGDGDGPHPSKFNDPPPNPYLSNGEEKDEDSDDDAKNVRDGKLGSSGERGGGLGLGGTPPSGDFSAASSSD